MKRQLWLQKKKERREKIVEFKRAHSYYETAKHFDISPTRVVQIIKEEKISKLSPRTKLIRKLGFGQK